MSFPHRVRTVYVKELIDILRDRRTLIAMIIVPIVLYPLLMVGSIQVMAIQKETVVQEQIFVGILEKPGQREALTLLVNEDVVPYRRLKEQDPDSAERERGLGESVEAPPFPNQEAIEAAVRNRSIHIGLIFHDEIKDDYHQSNEIDAFYDEQETRSVSAYVRLLNTINRANKEYNRSRLKRLNLPDTFNQPFVLNSVDLSSPPSILAHILPLILVLMTITGAIYPAIDLTAGERERGTLETLMVCPVPTIDLIFGKFLVVTTIAIMGAALNLGSVCATVYFGGFDALVAGPGGGVPYGQMALILVCLIPFAVLMSAIMLAVCSYARTFKEAQNYVTPVILAVLIPGGIAAMPTSRLDGIMQIVPVGNMVVLSRDLLIGAAVPVMDVLMVLLSTTLYAGAAVAVAAKVFGKESVVFTDAGSIKGLLTRRLIKPSVTPTLTMALLFVALLFPTWFFVQSALGGDGDNTAPAVLRGTGLWMPVFFVLLPLAVMLYWKVSPVGGFALRRPKPRFVLAALLLGLSLWVLAWELSALQRYLVETPAALIENNKALMEALQAMPVALALLYVAAVPGLCEEFLFRGFLLGGLASSAGKWTSIVMSGLIFGIFHFFLFKIPVTAGLGIVLAFLCWQSRSIWPGVLAHMIHNALGAMLVLNPDWLDVLGMSVEAEQAGNHLPIHILVVGGAIFVIGWFLAARRSPGAIAKSSFFPAPIPERAAGES